MSASRFLVAAFLGACLAIPAWAADGEEWARYRLHGDKTWQTVRPVENPGYRVRLSAPDGTTLEARVEIDRYPLLDEAPMPPDPATLSPEARAVLAAPRAHDEELERVSAGLVRGTETVLEAVQRVIAFTARRIRYELPTPGGREETAAGTLRSGRGGCVGRSLLAAEILNRAGIPARQVTGVLTAATETELTPDTRAAYSDYLGGVRHRWIEAYVPGLGWVPSDPGGLANTITSRHLALSGPPLRDFQVETVLRSKSARTPTLPGLPGLVPRLGTSVAETRDIKGAP